MEDGGEQICVEQTFCRVQEEKASGPILCLNDDDDDDDDDENLINRSA